MLATILQSTVLLLALCMLSTPTNAAPADFSKCVTTYTQRTKSRMTLIAQNDGLYPTYQNRLSNSRYLGTRPGFFVLPLSSRDVAAAVQCSNKAGMRFVVRGGGHSYEGLSMLSGGVVIDMSRFTGMSVDQKRNMVTVGAGQRLGSLYLHLWNNGRYAFPGGVCPAVGIAGLTTGGGSGLNVRRLGLASDALQSAVLVTASGRIVTVSAGSFPDLFFAIRGGGGSFGVVTYFTFRLTKAPPSLTVMELSCSTSRLPEFLAAVAQWKPYRLPPAVSFVEWTARASGTNLRIIYWGGAAALQRLMAGAPVMKVPSIRVDSVKESSYLEAVVGITNIKGRGDWGADKLTLQALTRDEYTPSGPGTGPSPFKSVSLTFSQDLSRSAAVTIQNLVAANPGGFIQGNAKGAAHNAPAVGATAYPLRRVLWVMQIWTGGNFEWVAGAKNSLAKFATGLEYLNYIDCNNPKAKQWQIYFGPNAARLQSIKKKYDPTGRFNALCSSPELDARVDNATVDGTIDSEAFGGQAAVNAVELKDVELVDGVEVSGAEAGSGSTPTGTKTTGSGAVPTNAGGDSAAAGGGSTPAAGSTGGPPSSSGSTPARSGAAEGRGRPSWALMVLSAGLAALAARCCALCSPSGHCS